MGETESNLITVVRSDVDKLALAILDVISVARSNGVTSWLCYGALLGMIREDRLLPWNNDAELACWYADGIEEKFRRIADELSLKDYSVFYYSGARALTVRGDAGVVVNLNIFSREEGFCVRPSETAQEPGAAPFLSHLFYWLGILLTAYVPAHMTASRFPFPSRGRVKIGAVNAFRILPTYLRRGLFLGCIRISKALGGRCEKTRMPSRYFDRLKSIKFYGSTVLVPDDSEGLLALIYGKGWRVPKDKWSFYAAENKSETGIQFVNESFDYAGMRII